MNTKFQLVAWLILSVFIFNGCDKEDDIEPTSLESLDEYIAENKPTGIYRL